MSGATSSSRSAAPVHSADATSTDGCAPQVALITGAARRIGAGIARALHGAGVNVALHCNSSRRDADKLAESLNRNRSQSATVVCADLADPDQCQLLIEQTETALGALDILVNNASAFFPTPVGSVDLEQWDALMASNLKGPFFLSQSALPSLARNGAGAIINIGDIHGQTPMANHSVYSAAKAGLLMLTRALAKDLAPEVRVNAVCPGSILWPEPEPSDEIKAKILSRVPMGRSGEVSDIADAVCFLALGAPYVTGQILSVDGGRSLNM